MRLDRRVREASSLKFSHNYSKRQRAAFFVVCATTAIWLVGLKRIFFGEGLFPSLWVRLASKGHFRDLSTPSQPRKYAKPIKVGDTLRHDDDIHIVFSTGCNQFQHWQSQLLLASAQSVGQKGWITRIACGCDYDDEGLPDAGLLTHPLGISDQMTPLSELKKSVFKKFRLHVAPIFEGAKNYPWLNKPQALVHWLKFADPPVTQTIVALIDPDFIFLRPLVVSQSGLDIISSTKVPVRELNSSVTRGHGVGQTYGIGHNWLKHVTAVCGQDSNAKHFSEEEADRYFQVGPPYILHLDDWKALAPLYTLFMKRMVKITGPGILTDMYGYAMAAAHLNIIHTRLDHFMVSDTGSRDGGGEAWKWANPSKWDPCKGQLTTEDGKQMPTFLHLCQNIYLEEPNIDESWMFHKGHVPPNILQCDLPILKTPPSTHLQHQLALPENKDKTNYKKHRAAWLHCMIFPSLNNALVEYKQQFCPAGFNTKKQFKLIHNDVSDKVLPICPMEKEGKTCWVFARIEKEQLD